MRLYVPAVETGWVAKLKCTDEELDRLFWPEAAGESFDDPEAVAS